MKKLKFNVTGMSCAACQAHVEKAVSKVEGVMGRKRELACKQNDGGS